jgi:hypothetical protein
VGITKDLAGSDFEDVRHLKNHGELDDKISIDFWRLRKPTSNLSSTAKVLRTCSKKLVRKEVCKRVEEGKAAS